jgi:hypothetical protein
LFAFAFVLAGFLGFFFPKEIPHPKASKFLRKPNSEVVEKSVKLESSGHSGAYELVFLKLAQGNASLYGTSCSL